MGNIIEDAKRREAERQAEKLERERAEKDAHVRRFLESMEKSKLLSELHSNGKSALYESGVILALKESAPLLKPLLINAANLHRLKIESIGSSFSDSQSGGWDYEKYVLSVFAQYSGGKVFDKKISGDVLHYDGTGQIMASVYLSLNLDMDLSFNTFPFNKRWELSNSNDANTLTLPEKVWRQNSGALSDNLQKAITNPIITLQEHSRVINRIDSSYGGNING